MHRVCGLRARGKVRRRIRMRIRDNVRHSGRVAIVPPITDIRHKRKEMLAGTRARTARRRMRFARRMLERIKPYTLTARVA
jgi:hypothetical protein